MKRIGCITCPIIGTAFNYGKIFLPLVIPNIDLTYMVYMFQYDFVNVNGTVEDVNMKYVINREGISVFQE